MMGQFLKLEKRVQTEFKRTSPYFSDGVREDGVYRGKPRPFCLPLAYAAENLYSEIRQTAPTYFAANKIRWHDGKNGNPSNHLCSSQVCCVNFLFPFADKSESLVGLLRTIYPDIRKTVPLEGGLHVAFEWIGERDYLGEGPDRKRKRTRGANSTSADAAVLFELEDGRRQMVLIEWKYTESYGRTFLKTSRNGTDRSAIYRPLFDQSDCPIRKDLLPSFDSLFYEPFYQFMRQQMLAHEMEKAQELGADIVSVLHIAPGRNRDFQRVTSPELAELGGTATQAWQTLISPRNRFVSVTTEQLFGDLAVDRMPEMGDWLEYIRRRYAWVGARC